MSGGPGDDQLIGEAGDDVLDGGLGNDRMYGAEGDDVLRSRDLFPDLGVDCGDGNDVVFADPLDTPANCETVKTGLG